MNQVVRVVLSLIVALVVFNGCDNNKGSNTFIPILGDSDNVLSIILNKNSTTILAGGTEQLTATIIPANAKNQNIAWDSSDNSVVTVSNDGLLTAVDEGIADITVTTEDSDLEATCEVTVSAVPVPVSDITLNKDETTLVVGNSELLTADIDPDDATNQNISWISTNESIATVSTGGLLAAIAPGSASITAITQDGLYTDSCVVTVNDATIPAEVTSVTAATGDGQITLNWTDPTDTDFDHVEITWTPGGTSSVSVVKGSQTYTVLGLSNGTEYTFTVKSVDLYGNKSTGSTAAETPYNIREGLFGEWMFKGNSNDSTGYGHNGTVYGATLASDRFGYANSAYSYDGTNDYIDLGAFFSLQTFTVSVWVKNTRVSTDWTGIIDNNHDSSVSWALHVPPNTSNYVFWEMQSAGYPDQWIHIVICKTPELASMYINGVFMGTSDYVKGESTAVPYDGTERINLGRSTRFGRYFKGSIDDIRMYNRVLSSAEVNSLYHEDGWDVNKQIYTADGARFKMAYVSAKSFLTGTGDSGTASVSSPFWIGDSEVTYELWYKVHAWAMANGYMFANPGREGHDGIITDPSGAAPTAAEYEPVTTINWRDAMIWCNALTEWYNANMGTNYGCVYKDGGTPIRNSSDTNAAQCDSVTPDASATGFRLLSSGEWELAARYISDSNHDGDISDDGEYYPGIYASGAADSTGNIPATNIVAWWSPNSGSATHDVMGLLANALGLYDMSGNVHEWCFDWTTPGSIRMIRGGSWNGSVDLRLGYIGIYSPQDENYNIGLRIARNQ